MPSEASPLRVVRAGANGYEARVRREPSPEIPIRDLSVWVTGNPEIRRTCR
jgi:hypothetical protein